MDEQLIGNTKENAINLLKALSVPYRIVCEDGNDFYFPMIVWVGIELTITNGLVSSCKIAGI